ncbi:MAG TPA: carboxy terminal-processing peptidase [Verrucomicrobiae bacterium]|nr:carboxy terminal-processing peptidase [Verrucomicrobiae bacterium]
MKTFNTIGKAKPAAQPASLTSWASRRQQSRRSLAIVLGLALAIGGLAATLRPPEADDAADLDEEAAIAQVSAYLLENSHYTGHRLDDAMASRFLDRYLQMLDGNRSYFLESDLAEFAPLRTRLDDLTLRRGDTSPAEQIFERFKERLEQRVAYVQELLKTEKFEFSGNDTYTGDREREPRPRDLTEAKQLWRQQLRYEYLQELLNDKQPDEIVKTLKRRYDRLAHNLKQWNHDRVFELYLTALANVYDPHSDYMGRRQLEDFSISMNLSLAGIGATLRSEDGYCKLQELVAGGPAARSKLLKAGDRIVAVAQDGQAPVDVIDMPLQEAVSLIRGPKGTSVQLTVIPADSTDSSTLKTITLVRDEIKLEDQEAKARILDLPGKDDTTLRLGIIDLPSFYSGVQGGKGGEEKSATADVAKLVRKLKRENIQGLILDLRHNGGGSLEEAVSLTGLFIHRGPVVQTKSAEGLMKVENDPDASVLYAGPLIVLTSRLSASASEILAGALQDYGRALIVGDPATFGKGTVQTVLPLSSMMRRAGMEVAADPGALKLTIGKFYRPDGASTQLRGVKSDLVLASPTAKLRIGESEMTDPLPWDRVRPVRHMNYDLVEPYLETLAENSRKRLATDPDFIWEGKDLERIQQRLDNPTVSLNLAERRAEKAELDKEAARRKQELAGQTKPLPKQYAITLRNADSAGLPEAMTVSRNSRPSNLLSNASSATNDESGAENDLEHDSRDIVLEETVRILGDYVNLTAPTKPTVAAKTASSIN